MTIFKQLTFFNILGLILKINFNRSLENYKHNCTLFSLYLQEIEVGPKKDGQIQSHLICRKVMIKPKWYILKIFFLSRIDIWIKFELFNFKLKEKYFSTTQKHFPLYIIHKKVQNNNKKIKKWGLIWKFQFLQSRDKYLIWIILNIFHVELRIISALIASI